MCSINPFDISDIASIPGESREDWLARTQSVRQCLRTLIVYHSDKIDAR